MRISASSLRRFLSELYEQAGAYVEVPEADGAKQARHTASQQREVWSPSSAPESRRDESVRRLLTLNTPAITDALDILGIGRGGVLTHLAPLSNEARVGGKVIVLEVASNPVQSCDAEPDALALAQPGDVAVVVSSAPTEVAVWGGLLQQAAKVHRLAGVIVDGACRDIEEMRKLRLPLFARGASPRYAAGLSLRAAKHVSVRGREIETGDYVLADLSGIVVLPADGLTRVIDTASRVRAADRKLSSLLLSGKPLADVMAARPSHLPPGRG